MVYTQIYKLNTVAKESRKKVARVDNLKLEYQAEMLKTENALLRDRIKDLNRLLDTKQKNDTDIDNSIGRRVLSDYKNHT